MSEQKNQALNEDSSNEIVPQWPNSRYYIEYLIALDRTNKVVISEDVFAKDGHLIAHAGTRISAEVAAKVTYEVGVRIENSINIECPLDNDKIMQHFHQLFSLYSDIQTIHTATDFAISFESMVIEVTLDPLLMQYLTVLESQIPVIFEKCIFCAWLAALLAKQLQLDDFSIKTAYMAGLVHDIGLLYVAPLIFNKREVLSAAEWHAIENHVMHGAQILQQIPNIHAKVPRAILEHHENCAGEGYPMAKNSKELELLGQIISMADTLQAIRINRFSAVGRNLRDTVPFLKMNTHTHFFDVSQAMMAILKKTQLEPNLVNPFGDMTLYAATLLSRNNLIRYFMQLLEEIPDFLKKVTVKTRGRYLLKIADNALIMIVRSGVARDEVVEWLMGLMQHADDNELADLCDIELVLDELVWHVKRVRQVLEDYLEHECDPTNEHYNELSDISNNMLTCVDLFDPLGVMLQTED